MNIAILGTGNWGTALSKAFTTAGHSVHYGSHTPDQKTKWAASIGPLVRVGTYQQAAQFGEVVVVATPWPGNGTVDALQAIGPIPDKILVDAINALQADYSPLRFDQADSGAEEVARLRPEARVVKAFNSVSGYTLGNARLQFGDANVTGFYCGDDEAARQVVGTLVQEAGLTALDAGPLRNARYLESLGQLLIALAFGQGLGVDSGFDFLHRKTV